MDVLLDRYEVLGQLGSGGLAEILRVRDRAVPGRILALKRQHAHIQSSELLNEFLALAQVQHRNLPTIYDYHDDVGDGRPGYTLEEVDGDTADKVAARIGPDRVPEIATGLLRALAHIHARGLTHGDLHPHNLIVRERADALDVKVLDLSPGTPRSGGMSALPFLAPERLEGLPPSPASDLFSVGVTLHRLLTGSLPYPDYPHIPESGAEGADALGALRDVVLQLMSKKPDQRPADAAVALSTIAAAIGREIPLITHDIVHATLINGPTRQVGGWPAEHVDAVAGDLLDTGKAGIIALSGALGSGRSRTLREIKWALQSRPAAPLVLSTSAARGDADGGAIRRLMTQIPSSERSAMPPEVAQALEALAEDRLLQVDESQEPAKARGMAVDRLARSLAWLGRRRQLVVLVDDVDELDTLGWEVLRATARYVAHRPDEAGALALVVAGTPGDALDALLADAGANGRTKSPPAFDESAIGGLLSTTFLGRVPTHRLVKAVSQVTGGNPLVIGEAVSAGFRKGWITLGEQDVDLAEGAPDPLTVPTSAADAVVSRLDTVDDAWPLLAWMAWSATAVPASLASAAMGVEDAEAGRLIESLRAIGVLRWAVDEGEARLSFATPILSTAAAERGAPPPALFKRIAALKADSLSLAGQVAHAEAGLALDASNSDRATEVARELVRRGKASEALLLLDRVDSPDGRVFGDAHAMLGNDEAALTAYATLGEHEANERAGVLLIRLGRYPEALARLEPSQDELPADALAWMARAQMMQSQYDSALALCDRAQKIGEASVGPRVDYLRGLVEFYRGDYAAGMTYFNAALHAWTEAEELIGQANVVNAIGLIHFRQGELGRAQDRFRAAIAIADKSGDRERMLLTLMNVATIHQERGEYGLAETRYNEALSMARVLGHRSGAMKVSQNVGNLYRYLGELDKAAIYIEQSLEIAQADGNRYIECHNRTLLGEMAWLADKPFEATQQLTQALAGFNAVGSVSEVADCERSLASAALDRGDITTAETHAHNALRMATEKGVPRVEILARLTLADIERRRNGGDLDQALTRLEEAREKLGTPPRPDLHWQVLLGLNRVRRARGEGERAMAVGVEALEALEALAAGLPEARRAQFLSVRNRRDAMRELRWLLELSAGSKDGGEPAGKLARLLDVNQRLNQELDLSRLLEYIIDSAILLSGAERGFLLMVDESKKDGELKVVVARNIDQENIRNKRHKVSYTIAERVIESGEAVLTTDAMGDQRYSEYLSIHHLKLRSVLCLPMSRQGKVLGALYIDNRFQRNAFSDEDLAFMEAFANQAAIALTNAQILEERQRVANDLAESQAKVEELNEKLKARLEEKQKALAETERIVAVQQRQLERSHGYDSIVGDSAALNQVFHVLDRVCTSEISVLVTGESGTGKELVARAVHYNGPRKNRPFVAINCSSIPETLIESELFGHVRGAFTGASADKKGVFEVAHRGTLFLDEIGEMPIEMQAKLLRALQEGEIQKVGSARPVKVDVRIIAATNRNLREMIKAKRFREDLYYRLAVVTIPLPPLRDRSDDIPILVRHFIEKNQAAGLGSVSAISSETLRFLMRYQWPGNVRELETVVKNASIFCEGDILQPQDLSNFPNIVGDTAGETEARAPTTRAVRPLAELEREAIIYALEVNGGNKKRTAEQLGIDRRTLYNKLAAYGISVERRAHVLGRDS